MRVSLVTRARRACTYANVVATIALALSLGGTAYAAVILTGANIRNGSLTGIDLRDRSITGVDIKPNSLGSGQVGIIGPIDMRSKSITGAQLADGAVGSSIVADGSLRLDDIAPADRAALPITQLKRAQLVVGAAPQLLQAVGPLDMKARCISPNQDAEGVITFEFVTRTNDIAIGEDLDLDVGETHTETISTTGGIASTVISASNQAGEVWGIIVQGGRTGTGPGGGCTVAGIVVQGGAPVRGIIVQGG